MKNFTLMSLFAMSVKVFMAGEVCAFVLKPALKAADKPYVFTVENSSPFEIDVQAVEERFVDPKDRNNLYQPRSFTRARLVPAGSKAGATKRFAHDWMESGVDVSKRLIFISVPASNKNEKFAQSQGIALPLKQMLLIEWLPLVGNYTISLRIGFDKKKKRLTIIQSNGNIHATSVEALEALDDITGDLDSFLGGGYGDAN